MTDLGAIVVAAISAIGTVVVAVISAHNRREFKTIRTDAEFVRNQLTPTNGHRVAESVELAHENIKELRRFVEEEFRFHRAIEHRAS